jgi:N-acetylglucosamine-6-sulfatase
MGMRRDVDAGRGSAARARSWTHRARRRPALLLVLVAAATVASGVGPTGLRSVQAAPVRPPNIVLILTDDQRWDSLWAMPNVQSLLVDHGVRFDNAFVSNARCCPSRTSILTGDYSHTTGVYTNGAPNGGFQAFDDSSTAATWLHDAGYRTALIGKYLNEYKDTTYVPPGWDRWFAFEGPAYYDYTMNDDGSFVSYGHDPADYSTDVLAQQAVDFIHRGSSPFFLYFAPFAPHAPAKPAPQDATAFSDLAKWRPPSYNEQDVSDKPAAIRDLPLLDASARQDISSLRRRQYRSLQAVDRAVGALVGELDAMHSLDNTLIVFMSDNGLAWGEHRWSGKQVPYEESIRVPLVIRYDPLTSVPRVDDRMVANVDLSPTWAELAGAAAPSMEGQSLMPLLDGTDVPWRTDLLLEHMHSVEPDSPPTYCGLRGENDLYVAYGTGEEELYDLSTDPYELVNRAGDPEMLPTLEAMRLRLGALCNPAPRGLRLHP